MKNIPRKTLRLSIAALAAGAFAAGATASADDPPRSTGVAPQPVPAEDMRLVIKDVAIFGAGGAELRRHHCEWTEPQDDDRPCLAFSGDPQQAYREIEDAGGSGATVTTDVPDLELESETAISERGDGTWLFRTQGSQGGREFHRGYVCSADGRTCTPYEARSERREKRAIKAATAKLKKRVARR